MNAKLVTLLGVTGLATCTLMAGPLLVVQSPVIVVAPVVRAPVVTVNVGVPDEYVWDGYEYVGLVGGHYYYLGPDHVWLTFDGPRLERFHGWERGHADWRLHAIRNDQYRRDAHGHQVPFHDAHAAPVNDHSHDSDHGHDADHAHDSDHGHDADDHHDH